MDTTFKCSLKEVIALTAEKLFWKTTTKYLGVNHIFSKPKHTTSLKKVSIAGVLLLFLWIFSEKLFCRTPVNSCLSLPCRHLLVQSRQWKQQTNVWNLFAVKNKDTITTWLLTLNKFLTLLWSFHEWLGTCKCRHGSGFSERQNNFQIEILT